MMRWGKMTTMSAMYIFELQEIRTSVMETATVVVIMTICIIIATCKPVSRETNGPFHQATTKTSNPSQSQQKHAAKIILTPVSQSTHVINKTGM